MALSASIKQMSGLLKTWWSRLFGDGQKAGQLSHQVLGRMASWHVRSCKVIHSLQDVEFRINSQWGQDGIIDWLIERAQIPPSVQSFIEFGVEDYKEANTRFLLHNRNWRGLIMDGGHAMEAAVKTQYLDCGYDLTLKRAFITRENINDLIADAGWRGDIGLLSVDIDGNDYWVWEAIHVVNPIICVCEYNAVFGDLHPISVPYDKSFWRARAHYSYLYFGASLPAVRSLAARKGYRFVGTNSNGNDAFFVREDYAGRFVDQSLETNLAVPSLFRESRDRRGQMNRVGGAERLSLIIELPIVNVETEMTSRLADLGQVYSDEWRDAMSHGS